MVGPKNRFNNQEGLIPHFKELLTKVFQTQKSPVKVLKILHLPGLQKPGLQQHKKLKLMSVEFIKLLGTEIFVSETVHEISKREAYKPKNVAKLLSKLRSEDVAGNVLPSILSCSNMNRKSWIATISNQQHQIQQSNRIDLWLNKLMQLLISEEMHISNCT